MTLHPSYHYLLIELNQLTSTHVQLLLAPKDDAMPYLAGQYIYLQYPNGDFFPFSIANSPEQDKRLELHIRVSPYDEATKEFIESLQKGSALTLAGPYGSCFYENSSGPLILLAAGTGFAPAKAIIEQVIKLNSLRECHLYWSVKRQEDIYLPSLLTTWKELLENFNYQVLITNIKTDDRPNILESVKKDFNDFSNSQIFVFGPLNLAIETYHEFKAKGLKKENFFTDMLSKEEVLKL